MFGLSARFQRAIYYFVERKSYRQKAFVRPAQQPSVSDYVAENVFNWKHADGRINASPVDDKGAAQAYYAVTASIYHPQFRSQVEDGVWPIISELVEKNYLPLSSCEGHPWTRLFVAVAFGSEQQAHKFAEQLRSSVHAPTLFVRFLDRYSHQEMSLSDDKTENESKIVVQKRSVFDYRKEADHLNKIFLRQHERYYFVEFGLFEFKQENLSFNLYMWMMKKIWGRKAYNQLFHYFKTNQLPFSE